MTLMIRTQAKGTKYEKKVQYKKTSAFRNIVYVLPWLLDQKAEVWKKIAKPYTDHIAETLKFIEDRADKKEEAITAKTPNSEDISCFLLNLRGECVNNYDDLALSIAKFQY